MKAKKELPTGLSYPQLLTLEATLTSRTPGFSFVRFEVKSFLTLSCAGNKSDVHLFLVGELSASDN